MSLFSDPGPKESFSSGSGSTWVDYPGVNSVILAGKVEKGEAVLSSIWWRESVVLVASRSKLGVYFRHLLFYNRLIPLCCSKCDPYFYTSNFQYFYDWSAS